MTWGPGDGPSRRRLPPEAGPSRDGAAVVAVAEDGPRASAGAPESAARSVSAKKAVILRWPRGVGGMLVSGSNLLLRSRGSSDFQILLLHGLPVLLQR